ncbi:MAG: SpaA isopeptide-forming pilin-related protein, partial [Clostridia bacterium]|nr:SpaA isopeptide-forming pilin-related protein [Clostridia bacterium]
MIGNFKRNGKRFWASILCIAVCIVSVPFSVFAFDFEEGKRVDAYYGDHYIGADGKQYYSPETQKYIVYDKNGNITVASKSAGHARTKLMIKDGSGARQVMCVEAGVDFNADGSYNSYNGKNSAFFRSLPEEVKNGMLLTSVCGWQPGKTAPVSGTNEDDFSLATQIILWEYQQQLRTSPTTIANNSYGVAADLYYKGIKGRPAEKCYNWILSQMKAHNTPLSFASKDKSTANTYILKYNKEKGNYALTVTDTNNTLSDIRFDSTSGITVSRNGNKYTFTSEKMIENSESLTINKSVNIGEKLLLWGYPGKQTMMTGAEDPIEFYLNIKTETTGVGHIVKYSEDKKIDNVKFRITGNGVNQTVTTGKDGTVDIELMPGDYIVKEIVDNKYETQKIQRITIVSGHTSTVTFTNKLKRGDLRIIKSSEDNLNEGVTFHLYGTSLSGIAVDEYAVTDANGVATFEGVLISG